MTDHSALIERLEVMGRSHRAHESGLRKRLAAGDRSLSVQDPDNAARSAETCEKAVAALRALTEWRDIATAPKDGTEFQAWVMSDSPNWKQGWWEPKACIDPENGGLLIWGRVDYDAEGWDPYPATGARWLPLPSAPNQAKEAGE